MTREEQINLYLKEREISKLNVLWEKFKNIKLK